MKMLTASIVEFKEPEIAIDEILEQLQIQKNLLKNSVGFITSSPDFFESGILQAITSALPFPIVGCTSFLNANNCCCEDKILCLTVLTASDCEFTVANTSLTLDNFSTDITRAYIEAKEKLGNEPKLIFSFIPFINSINGGEIFQVVKNVSKTCPVFGLVACDSHINHPGRAQVLNQYGCGYNNLSLILIAGNINPQFFIASFTHDNVFQKYHFITSGDNFSIRTVNGFTFKEFLVSFGFFQNNASEDFSAVPVVINHNDGSIPEVRAIHSLTSEGFALCGGITSSGSTLSIGHLDFDDILKTTEQSIINISQIANTNGAIIFSCLGRQTVLGADLRAEINLVQKHIPHSIPWHFAYSAGEICPTLSLEANFINRFHNYTFVACTF